MHPDVQEILFDEATVQKRVGELAQQIAEDYRHSDKKIGTALYPERLCCVHGRSDEKDPDPRGN